MIAALLSASAYGLSLVALSVLRLVVNPKSVVVCGLVIIVILGSVVSLLFNQKAAGQ